MGAAGTPEDSSEAGRPKDPSEAEAYLGFRIWRVREGQLLSLTNDTVWPREYALAARFGIDVGPLVMRFAAVVLAVGWLVLLPISSEFWMVGGQSAYDHFVDQVPLGDAWRKLLAAMLTVVALIVALLFIPLLLPPLATLVKTWAAVVRWRRRNVVTPGSNTPGIFAMRRLEDVQADLVPPVLLMSGEAYIIVRGSVWVWGDTIEHQWGVKGEIGYPEALMDVLCVRCDAWIPLDEYDERTGPPIHPSCPIPVRWAGELRVWIADALFVRLLQRRWQPVGLVELREAAPQWFEAAKLPESPSVASTA